MVVLGWADIFGAGDVDGTSLRTRGVGQHGLCKSVHVLLYLETRAFSLEPGHEHMCESTTCDMVQACVP